jgi:tRNA(Ile)-lysidine synthase
LPRSHPPTLITLVRATVREHELIARGDTVVVAVSGGADSMALLHVLGLLRRELAFGLFAHGVDHGLRPEAAAELDQAEAFARSLDVPFERTGVRLAAGSNLQARARAVRWEALEAAAGRAGACRIATGHHADDRAETMLMRMLRGTGARHLGALPAISGKRIRPMIRARRADIDAHVLRHRIPHSQDPSNRNPRFLRTRVRLELLPLLERLNPRVVDHMCAIADELAALDIPGRGSVLTPLPGPTQAHRRASESSNGALDDARSGSNRHAKHRDRAADPKDCPKETKPRRA